MIQVERALRFVRRAWKRTRRARGPVAANGRGVVGVNQRSRALAPVVLQPWRLTGGFTATSSATRLS